MVQSAARKLGVTEANQESALIKPLDDNSGLKFPFQESVPLHEIKDKIIEFETSLSGPFSPLYNFTEDQEVEITHKAGREVISLDPEPYEMPDFKYQPTSVKTVISPQEGGRLACQDCLYRLIDDHLSHCNFEDLKLLALPHPKQKGSVLLLIHCPGE